MLLLLLVNWLAGASQQYASPFSCSSAVVGGLLEIW